MKRIKIDKLNPGDIILTASQTKVGWGIRATTRGIVSHAMIYVQHSSIIDSTSSGVQAWNLQRAFFENEEKVFVFRHREELPQGSIARVIDFARSEIGTRYSKREAARSVVGGHKPRNGRQFCSRLVARAYGSIGVKLVADQDYCTPEDLRASPLLVELTDVTEAVATEEVDFWRERHNPIQMMQDAQNAVLAVARRLDPRVENFSDLDQLVREHSEWDPQIAKAYRDSGYLDLWKHERAANPWRYDRALMDKITDPIKLADLRAENIETIREAYSGGMRYAVNLVHYQAMQQAYPRETTGLLVKLYETLVHNDHLWRETARAWLLQYHPGDVTKYMQRVTPHSELWFSFVDRVEPNLGAIARLSIEREQSLDVCSSCGDPAHDYRIANSPDVMPGVPSLRLCDDCVSIRRSFGEILEPIG